MRALWIVVVAACGSSDPAPSQPDAPPYRGPITYTLNTFWAHNVQEIQPRPTVYIDGMQTELLTLQYANAAEALAQPHTFELKHGDVVVRSRTTGSNDCLAQVPDATNASTTLCAYSNGDLRYAGDSASGGTGGCNGDAFCGPDCDVISNMRCSLGERCTSIYALVDPIATHLGCAPLGPKALGDACILVTDTSGTHDDCGDQLLCIAGTCKQVCKPAFLPPGCMSCEPVPGHAPELGVCN